MEEKTKLIVIVGETASGKSALALQLAQRFDGELICADSMTVRKEATIGTAKPTAAEQALVPHHLHDIVAPDADFSAAQFKEQAQQAIVEITARGKLPIMVGGTGLYIDSVLYDYEFRNAADAIERAVLNAKSLGELQAMVAERGLATEGIDTQNPYRLVRLLETGGQTAAKKPLRENTLLLGVRPLRQELLTRIENRVDAMLEAGLENEVKTLSENYGWSAPALNSIGYREWQDYFAGHNTMAETRLSIIKDTKDLAKRQRTWFGRNKSIHWLSTPIKYDDVVDSVTTFLSH
ncbi:MAG: tRNA (adenosine(37)-N6)-dimethylallyltransferase MiaA [Patescibacteria group bacterium]|nr:tRNA (adenosine(37)-N6)-dimethylallyltransferase MiaA [Patescibacteria group bacterium]